MQSELSSIKFVGIRFAAATYDQAVTEIDRLSRLDGPSLVVTPNVDHVVMLHDTKGNPETVNSFAHAYEAATIRFCDSRILQTLAWLRGISIPVVTGSDLTALLFEDGWLDGRNVAVIGGDDAMLQGLQTRYPTIRLAQHVPPMGVLGNEAAIAQIEEFVKTGEWHYIFFIIGAPRSEIIAHRAMALAGVTGVAMCVGASIEFILGRKARAPMWMRVARLEWVFRLLSEPRRLWRRYLIKGPRIFEIFCREKNL